MHKLLQKKVTVITLVGFLQRKLLDGYENALNLKVIVV